MGANSSLNVTTIGGNTASSLNSTSKEDQAYEEESLGVLFPESSELHLREGNKSDPIPSPRASSQSQYNQILYSDEFKSHLFRNLDKDYLLTSLLTPNVTERSVLLEGISRLKFANGSRSSGGDINSKDSSSSCSPAEAKEKLKKDISNFERTITAGVNLELNETLENCKKELEFQGESE